MARLMRWAVLAACVAALGGACSAGRSDGEIVADVNKEFASSSVLAGAEIEVTSREGAVTLEGVVSSEAQRAQAVDLARGVEGVASVQSRLQLAGASEQSPPDVAAPPPEGPAAPM